MNVVILYEDSCGTSGTFPFHDLVVRAVADHTSVPDEKLWQLVRRIRPVPLRGNRNVLADVTNRERLERLRAPHVVVVLDRDKVMGLVPVGVATCKSSVTSALMQNVEPSSDVKIVLLEQNLESILAVILHTDPRLMGASEGGQQRGKNRLARDAVFIMARPRRDIRDALRKKVPSFAYLVEQIARRLR